MPRTAEPKTVALLGIPFHDVTMDETLSIIDDMVRERTPRYIATANLDFAAQADDDVELQRILLDAHLVLCDGMPLVWASRWLDAPLRERVAGSDLTLHLAERAAQRGHRLFFLGSDEDVLKKAKAAFETRFPGIKICGLYAPPYARLLDLNNDEITAMIRAARPDILLVALGAPKQEKWIHMHHREVNVPCCIGIGASLDFVAGKYSRAPVWMQRTGLEWLFRLLQEPSRLLGRYAHDFLFFFRALRRQKQAMQVRPPPAEETPEILSHPTGTVIHTWVGRIDAAGISAGEVTDPFPQAGQPYVWLNTAEVTFVDSTGLGLLLKAFHKAKEAGGGLIVLRPSASMRRMITSMKLDRLLPMAEDEEQARTLLKIEQPAEPPKAEFDGGTDQRLVCRWSGDLDLSKARDFAAYVRTQWLEREAAQLLQVDLTDVRFMDSSGLGSLLQTRKLVGGRPGARLELVGLNDNLRNVIRLARLEQLLGVAA